MASEQLESSINFLLSKIGRGQKGFQLESLSASGNNRVFILHCDGDKVVLKWYFHDLDDTRDRLLAEYNFLEHAWKMGLRCVPQPLGKELSSHIALYEYVEGQKIEAAQVGDDYVCQAAHFLAQLNTSQSRAAASALPEASEACFNIHAHLALVDARLLALNNMPLISDVDKAALKFVKRITKYWETTKVHLLIGCNRLGIIPNALLPKGQWVLSPSDFGFHNALVRPNGELCFFDFEYAGWDDPAKTLGDFFSHPGVAVEHKFFDSFMTQALEPLSQVENMTTRIRLLEPIFQMKWCCIMLNEFLPLATRRRNFANPGIDAHMRKVLQLEKATQLFESLQH